MALDLNNALQYQANQQHFDTVPTAQYTIVTGSINLIGQGVLQTDVIFPARFISANGLPPTFSAIGSVGDEAEAPPDSTTPISVIPTPTSEETDNEEEHPGVAFWDISVAKWETDDSEYSTRPLYKGATLWVSKRGGGKSGLVQWRCEGQALVYGESQVNG